ncbi:hypothetical protein ABZW11_45670 [Nonomuraea sp. NPDC004580]|uniref:hypothetical protein n=1 Tax=Nonomuraea sp. NPDC004580 TaxID=3154552 RepID=UPI0033B713C3
MRRGGHALAAVAGLAAAIPVYYLTDAAARALRGGTVAFAPAPAALAYVAGVAVLIRVLTVWPVAALACGVPLTAAGALFALDLDAAVGVAATLPWVRAGGLPWTTGPVPWAAPGEPPGTLAGMTGLYALTGAFLVLSALLPARRRSVLGG